MNQLKLVSCSEETGVFLAIGSTKSVSGLATSCDGLATFPSMAGPTAILIDVRLGSAVEVTPAPLSGSCLLLEIVDLLKSRNSKVLLVMPAFKMPGGGAACQPNASLCHKHTASCLTAFKVWMGHFFKKNFYFFVLLWFSLFFLLSFGDGCLICWANDAYRSFILHLATGGNFIGHNPRLLKALIQSDAQTSLTFSLDFILIIQTLMTFIDV